MLRAEALGVHLFVLTGGAHRDRALALLEEVWDGCGTVLGMTDPVERTGVAVQPESGWESLPGPASTGAAGLLAARRRPGSGVWQAALRRERDVLCLSVMLAPAAEESLGWRELDARWSAVLPAGDTLEGRPRSRGVLGVARLYLARLAEPGVRPAPDAGHPPAAVVRARTPADPAAPGSWPYRGVTVSRGFAVWEASAARDTRLERRLVVVAGHDQDRELTAWTWTTRARELPPLGKYLLYAAKLRHQLRVWSAAGSAGRLRDAADTAVAELLERTAAPHGPGREADLLRATRALVGLQARERGLVDRSTRSREMARTVEIAAANLAALGDSAPAHAAHVQLAPCGPFADDRALAEWFGRRLDDEATYLEAALRRCEQVGAFADQLLQRARQRRQETVNLGLTGAVGAVLMSLTAVQALQYTVPLPGPVKPAVVTALGALALLASLVVLRIVVPERRWTAALVRFGAAALGASLAWTAVSAAGGGTGAGWTWAGAGAGAVAGLAAAGAAARRSGRG
ncbi:CATRA conflict system CASPASE/TPR repeat-associated protein [Streptomyces fenghuangensis]